MKVRGAAATLALLLVFLASSTAQPPEPVINHLEFGNPGGACSMLDRTFYVVCYDAARRIPEWVGYKLTAGDLTHGLDRSDDFRADANLGASVRSELKDYRSSGFDRGHMAPAADFQRSELAMSTSFLLSNMAPQRPTLNRRIWERLEVQVRDLTRDQGTSWIVTGPLFTATLPPGYTATIGNGRVAVPTQFFKIVLSQDSAGAFHMFAFVMANSKNAIVGKPRDFEKTVDEVEALTSLDFFPNLASSIQAPLEAAVGAWPF